LRKLLSPLSPVDSMEFLLEKLKDTKTNADFLAAMNR
jgi:transcription termination factor Rho